MDTFQASAQYNDWKGDVAADNADKQGIEILMRERGLLSDNEFLVGVDLWLGEMHGSKLERPSVYAYVIDADKYENAEKTLKETSGPLRVKKVDLDLSMEEFLLLFKRFSLAISWRGLDLMGRELDVIEN